MLKKRIARRTRVACVALHGVGLAWAPMLLLCVWRDHASSLTLLGTVLTLTRAGIADTLLCAVWTIAGAALVALRVCGWAEHVAVGSVSGVVWLLLLVEPREAAFDPLRAAITLMQATIYEALCLATGASQREGWARYGAVLTCASSAPALAVSIAVLGAALSWARFRNTPAHISMADNTTKEGVDALDVQEAFRLARAQYLSAQQSNGGEKNA